MYVFFRVVFFNLETLVNYVLLVILVYWYFCYFLRVNHHGYRVNYSDFPYFWFWFCSIFPKFFIFSDYFLENFLLYYYYLHYCYLLVLLGLDFLEDFLYFLRFLFFVFIVFVSISFLFLVEWLFLDRI